MTVYKETFAFLKTYKKATTVLLLISCLLLTSLTLVENLKWAWAIQWLLLCFAFESCYIYVHLSLTHERPTTLLLALRRFFQIWWKFILARLVWQGPILISVIPVTISVLIISISSKHALINLLIFLGLFFLGTIIFISCISRLLLVEVDIVLRDVPLAEAIKTILQLTHNRSTNLIIIYFGLIALAIFIPTVLIGSAFIVTLILSAFLPKAVIETIRFSASLSSVVSLPILVVGIYKTYINLVEGSNLSSFSGKINRN